MDNPVVIWDIGVDGPISPGDPLPPMPEIPPAAIVILTGRAPVWRYGMAWHAIHGMAAVVCTNDPRLGWVVVASHAPGFSEGDVIDPKTREMAK